MDATRFDALSRSVGMHTGRRQALRGLGGLALGLGLTSPLATETAAKHKKPKLKRNKFGCVNVGDRCTKNGDCCSNICEGKKHKKCKAHDTEGCKAGQTVSDCGGTNVACGTDGSCTATTGKAGYCERSGDCFACSKDVDCEEACGAGAACIPCKLACSETGGTACVSFREDGCNVV